MAKSVVQNIRVYTRRRLVRKSELEPLPLLVRAFLSLERSREHGSLVNCADRRNIGESTFTRPAFPQTPPRSDRPVCRYAAVVVGESVREPPARPPRPAPLLHISSGTHALPSVPSARTGTTEIHIRRVSDVRVKFSTALEHAVIAATDNMNNVPIYIYIYVCVLLRQEQWSR